MNFIHRGLKNMGPTGRQAIGAYMPFCSKEKRQESGTSHTRKAIPMEMEKQMFAEPSETMGCRRTLVCKPCLGPVPIPSPYSVEVAGRTLCECCRRLKGCESSSRAFCASLSSAQNDPHFREAYSRHSFCTRPGPFPC